MVHTGSAPDADSRLLDAMTWQAGKSTDLYARAFGEMPDLGKILGSVDVASAVVEGGLTRAV